MTLILSPKCASPRISAQSPMVSDVPPPPLALVSRGSRDVTAAELVQFFVAINIISTSDSLPMVSTRPVNMIVAVFASWMKIRRCVF